MGSGPFKPIGPVDEKGQPKKPNPADYEDGSGKQEYEKALATYNNDMHDYMGDGDFNPRGPVYEDDVRGPTGNLIGKKGNPNGIGSKITAHFSDGSTRIKELHSGSSYLSQNPSSIDITYSKEISLKSISVIWPDNGKSTHEIPKQEQVTLNIKQP